MKVLVNKMTKLGILKAEMVIGAIVMLAAMIVPPISIGVTDPSLLSDPYILGMIIAVMLIFGALAYFLFMRPFFMYRKMPEVLAQTDGEYVYVYGKEEVKIPLSAFEGAMVTYHLPFIYSKELVAVLITYLFSEKYGDLILDVPGYGSYKLPFVSNVMQAANDLTAFLCEAQAPKLQ